ncbi:MAG: amidohydrolase, partial [Bacteroidota bacterium]
MAPSNISSFEKSSIPFAITIYGLKDKKLFHKNLRKSIDYGLTENAALKALTYTPAELLGVQDKVGALKKGMIASFFISGKSIFEEGASIHETWVNGNQFKFSDYNAPDIGGKYDLKIGTQKFSFSITQADDKLTSNIILKDTTKTAVNITFKNPLITIYYAADSINFNRLSGTYAEADKKFSGKGQDAKGDWFEWNLVKVEDVKSEAPKKQEKKITQYGGVIYPFTAYGKQYDDKFFKDKTKFRLGTALIKNVTVWTNESQGVLKDYDVYVENGKIKKIEDKIDGLALNPEQIIEGKGMHLTAGIIDEHSHIAISEGVNEGTQASSAEVSMGDVINSEDIN